MPAGAGEGSVQLRVIKIAGVVLVSYVLIVVAFESLIGYFQPEAPGTLVLTTVGEDGAAADRVLEALESDGRLYVAVNHWPRAWYRRVLANPGVQVTRDGGKRDYVAVPVADEEHARVDRDHPRPLAFLFVTGFPPRRIVRLDDVDAERR